MTKELYVPSEVVEPALVKWASIFIEELGMWKECPPKEWWANWRLRASGVSILLTIMNCPHASIAFTNQVLGPIICDWKWQETWECARKALGY